MIKQQNPDNPNTAVKIHATQPSKLVVNPFTFAGVTTKQQIFDLTAYQGGPFRLYVDDDGSFSSDIDKDHYWLIAEVIVPERKFESVSTGQTDEKGQEIMTLQEVPLNLHEAEITLYELPN